MNDNTLLEINIPVQEESIIKIFGIGGGGSNAVNHMCRQGIRGVEFVVCNTDLQALRSSPVKNRIQIGKELTEGRGAGSKPERGKQAAIENLDYIESILTSNTKMIFITAGMGGGTGTGAAPIIAKKAKELGILTVAIVTVPFNFEGQKRIKQAQDGIDELEEYVDALLIICNEKLRDMYGDLKLSNAFEMADNVLTTAAKSIAEIITLKGYVNVDFADVNVVMKDSGVALMGAGEAIGESRALEAVQQALRSPLLNSSDIRGASRILLNLLYGNKEVTMDEITLITDYLKELVGYDVNIIWGAGEDKTLGEELRVAVIATGFNRAPSERKRPPISFSVEEIPELKMEMEDSRKIEELERRRKMQQEQARRLREEQAREREEKERAERVRREQERRDRLEQERRDRLEQERRDRLEREEREEQKTSRVEFELETNTEYVELYPREERDKEEIKKPVEKERKKREKKSADERKFGERSRRESDLGVNEIPDVDSWFKKKFGNFFDEDLKRDHKM